MMKEYIGRRFGYPGPGKVTVVLKDDHGEPIEEYDLPTGMDNPDLPNHSPDGFQCGYTGSGPAQLAAALLYDVTDDAEQTAALKRAFLHGVVARLPTDDPEPGDGGINWRITEATIREWIEANTEAV